MDDIIIKKGRSGSPGYAVGKLYIYKRDQYHTPRKNIQDVETEYLRFENARISTIKSLESMYNMTRKRAGSKNADIFTAQSMMLQDEDYLLLIKSNMKVISFVAN